MLRSQHIPIELSILQIYIPVCVNSLLCPNSCKYLVDMQIHVCIHAFVYHTTYVSKISSSSCSQYNFAQLLVSKFGTDAYTVQSVYNF